MVHGNSKADPTCRPSKCPLRHKERNDTTSTTIAIGGIVQNNDHINFYHDGISRATRCHERAMESPRKGSSTSPLIVPIRVAGSASASVFSSSDEAPNAPSNAPTHESRPDEQGRDGNERNIKPGSRRPSSHLPSPLLTPTDPRSPADAIPDTAIGSNGVPTPDPSGDSHSDAEASSDSTNPPAALPDLEPPKEVALPAKTRSRSNTKTSNHDGKRRLSASKIQELTAAPESLPVASAPDRTSSPASAPLAQTAQQSMETLQAAQLGMSLVDTTEFPSFATANPPRAIHPSRPSIAARTVSTPLTSRRRSTGQSANATGGRRNSFQPVPRPIPLDLEGKSNFMPPPPPKPVTVVPPRKDLSEPVPPSPMLQSIPLPPMSIPTLLNLELAGQRPSPLYIHHSYASDLPYESSAVKFERLKNFLILPLYLERTIIFGALSCLDAWLWTFTILPLRFCVALSVLVRWWAYMFWKEVCWLVGFVWYGLGRMWSRGFRRGRGRDGNTNSREGDETSRSRSRSRVREVSGDNVAHAIATGVDTHPERLGDGLRSATVSKKSSSTGASSASRAGYRRHRRTKSHPSNLTSFNKADLLQGSLIIFTSLALMDLDASRMYHLVRAQSAIKLVAIYGLLEVSDRLLSALGQDILECLLSSETLSRDPRSGRSKVMLPLGMFLLALVYNVLHTVVLFYQVISLNVAVNSYSNNALLTLLLSNQFVEIKSTVFKRFEKENNFQLACADIVERFQLCIMLLIIGLRNIVEVGGLSLTGEGGGSGVFVGAGVIPASFKLLPDWLGGSGEVLSPFLVVLGSEVVVDCIKHAFVGKFNGLKAGFFGKVLDILCKDYYTGVSLDSFCCISMHPPCSEDVGARPSSLRSDIGFPSASRLHSTFANRLRRHL